MLKDWRGDIVFSESVAIFRGPVGENKSHCHWAAQITLGLSGPVTYEVSSEVVESDAVYFASKTPHRILSGVVCSIYFDPLFDTISKGFDEGAQDGWASLDRDALPSVFSTIDEETDLTQLLNSPPLNAPEPASRDARLQTVLQVIHTNLSTDTGIDRDALAAHINVSPSRFSHWFVEQTGVPLRSYKKWLKLRVAMDALLAGKTPMGAAMQAGFSDLAHMSREFSDSFGLTYLDAQRAWAYAQRFHTDNKAE